MPGAQAAAAPSNPAELKEALLGFRWSWSRPNPGKKGGAWATVLTFHEDGKISNPTDHHTWYWWVTDPHTVHVQFAPQAAQLIPGIGMNLTFDQSFSTYRGVETTGPSRIATGMRKAAVADRAIVVKKDEPFPATPTAPSKAAQSQIEVLSSQLPRATEWVASPLKTPIPATIRGAIQTLDVQLKNEARVTPQVSPVAYLAAGRICATLSDALVDRTQTTDRNRHFSNGVISEDWEKEWAVHTATFRVALTRLDTEFREAIRLSPPPSVPLAVANGVSIEFPPVPSAAAVALQTAPPKPARPPADQSDEVFVSGGGPSGTNFGGGDRKLKLHVSVSSPSEKPKKVVVDCLWVAWDGKHHVTCPVPGGHKDAAVFADHPMNYTLEDDQWGRDNGATRGILKPNVGVYRGWMISVHDGHGKKIAGASNLPEFGRLAP